MHTVEEGIISHKLSWFLDLFAIEYPLTDIKGCDLSGKDRIAQGSAPTRESWLTLVGLGLHLEYCQGTQS